MSKSAWVSIVVALLILSMATSSTASFGIGPKAGYFKTKDADKGEFMGGAAVRLKWASLGIEGSVDYRQEKYGEDDITIRNWPVSATGLLYPLPILYALAGMGWYNTTIDYDQSVTAYKNVKDETTQSVGWHFGGGVEIPFGTGSKITADIRYHFIDYDFSAFPGSKELKSNFYSINVSILFGF